MARSPLLTTRLVTAGTVELEARVHLAQINQPNRDQDAHNDADSKNSEHELCSPAPIHAVVSHDRSMAEREVLFDAVNVRWSEERRLSQRPAAFGAFALKQVAPASSSEQDFAARGYFETFGHRRPGFNAFGASHIHSLPLSTARCIHAPAWVARSSSVGLLLNQLASLATPQSGSAGHEFHAASGTLLPPQKRSTWAETRRKQVATIPRSTCSMRTGL
jgi:hypothetical protein